MSPEELFDFTVFDTFELLSEDHTIFHAFTNEDEANAWCKSHGYGLLGFSVGFALPLYVGHWQQLHPGRYPITVSVAMPDGTVADGLLITDAEKRRVLANGEAVTPAQLAAEVKSWQQRN